MAHWIHRAVVSYFNIPVTALYWAMQEKRIYELFLFLDCKPKGTEFRPGPLESSTFW